VRNGRFALFSQLSQLEQERAKVIATNYEEIKNDTYPDGDYYVYVFRCGEDILYIGESTYAPSRVWEHFRKQRTNRNLSEAIEVAGIENITVDMYDAADIVKGMGLPKQHVELWCQLYDVSQHEAVRLSGKDARKGYEEKLIYDMSPLCNGVGRKSDPQKVRALGDKYYYKLRIANSGVKLP
jgi:hypothetical protein